MLTFTFHILFTNKPYHSSISTLGGEVTQITTNKLKSRQTNVSISPPGIGELELSFCSVLGRFDALVDTLSDEAKLGDAVCMGLDDAYARDDASNSMCSSSVIRLLQKQNKCKRYISTMNSSQKLVQDDGIIWGRSKADGYGKDVVQKVTSPSRSNRFTGSPIVPPKKFGARTLQPLLDAGIVYTNKNKQNDVFMHGWNLQDFWETVTWPREAEGGNVRFGLPVIEDLDSLMDEEEEGDQMISAPPRMVGGAPTPEPPVDQFAGQKNPFVLDIYSLKELNSEILDEKKDCVLFLSAAYCRTCKYLNPQYTKLARDSVQGGNGIVFAKANAVGKVGKDISRALGVEAVPAFCFFKAGQRYGSTISISKIPSKKLDAALELLISGGQWDGKRINDLK